MDTYVLGQVVPPAPPPTAAARGLGAPPGRTVSTMTEQTPTPQNDTVDVEPVPVDIPDLEQLTEAAAGDVDQDPTAGAQVVEDEHQVDWDYIDAAVAAWTATADDVEPVALVEDNSADAWPTPPADWDPEAHQLVVGEVLATWDSAIVPTGDPSARVRTASVAGYPVSSTPASIGVRSFKVPGTTVSVPVRGDVAPLLIYFLREWHRRVEPLQKGWCWGYAFRLVRGGTVPSFHSAGIAVDANAPKHPLGTPPAETLNTRQITEILKILKELGGTVRWGGNYKGRKDTMHAEIIAPLEVALAMVKRLQAKPAPRDTVRPAPVVTPLAKWKPARPAGRRAVLRRGHAGYWVAYLQHLIGARRDGVFGPVTEARLRALQKALGLAVDGVAGPQTWAALGVPAGRPNKYATWKAVRPSGKVPVLRVGADGYWVAFLQVKIGATQTGMFDRATLAKLKAWQKSRKLTQDGVAGPAVWRAAGVK